MLRRVLIALAFAGVLVWPEAGLAQSATRGLHADRFEIQLTLLPDGSLQVAETITFLFTDRSFREVERRVPVRRVDGIIDVEALMDGRVLPEGRDAGQARIRIGRRELRVLWRFPETTNTTHQFTLRYRAMGAMRLDAAGARLDWHVLPTRHRYAISQAELLWQVPPGAVSIGGPALEAEGWEWTRENDRLWVARKSGVTVNETAILSDTIEPGTLQMAQPQWQIDEDRARQFAPAFIVAALVILVMGAGIIGMMFVRYHRPKVDGGGAAPAARGSLPPALATGLRGTRPVVGFHQLSATFFDLLSRGVLKLEDTSKETAKEKDRTFDVVASAGGFASLRLRPHEQVVVDTLWLDMKHGRVPLKTARQRLAGAQQKFANAVRDEMRDAGFLDEERQWASRGMTGTGIFTMLAGLVALVGFVVFLPGFGEAALLVPASVFLLGLAFVFAGLSFPTLSAAGMTSAAQWAARRRQLKDEARAGRANALANEWLPVAIGAGLGRQFDKSGAAVTWLQGVPNPSDALVVIMAAGGGSSSPGGGGAGIGGGGMAGGGGSSGAR